MRKLNSTYFDQNDNWLVMWKSNDQTADSSNLTVVQIEDDPITSIGLERPSIGSLTSWTDRSSLIFKTMGNIYQGMSTTFYWKCIDEDKTNHIAVGDAHNVKKRGENIENTMLKIRGATCFFILQILSKTWKIPSFFWFMKTGPLKT